MYRGTGWLYLRISSGDNAIGVELMAIWITEAEDWVIRNIPKDDFCQDKTQRKGK